MPRVKLGASLIFFSCKKSINLTFIHLQSFFLLFSSPNHQAPLPIILGILPTFLHWNVLKIIHNVFYSLFFFRLCFFLLIRNTILDKTTNNQDRNWHQSAQTEWWDCTIFVNKHASKNSTQASTESPVNSLEYSWKKIETNRSCPDHQIAKNIISKVDSTTKINFVKIWTWSTDREECCNPFVFSLKHFSLEPVLVSFRCLFFMSRDWVTKKSKQG